jgi:hypothetical protein
MSSDSITSAFIWNDGGIEDWNMQMEQRNNGK